MAHPSVLTYVRTTLHSSVRRRPRFDSFDLRQVRAHAMIRFILTSSRARWHNNNSMVAAKTPLPRLGLGMAALGRPGYINLNRTAILGDDRDVGMMQQQANAVMDKLFSLSAVPWLDCARSYGLSEKFVGEYLKSNKIKPTDVYVSSKWGYSKTFVVFLLLLCNDMCS